MLQFLYYYNSIREPGKTLIECNNNTITKDVLDAHSVLVSG